VSRRFDPSPTVERIRARLDHPIVDGDGHFVEFLPTVLDLMGDVAGPSVAAAYRERYLLDRPVSSRTRPGSRTFFAFPAEALDRATAMLPALLYERLDEIGIDFALLYPTMGLGTLAVPEAELRRGAARAFNTYYTELFAGLRDRLEPVAIIPMFTPDEAIEELDFAVGTLGFKAITTSGVVQRQLPRTDGSTVPWIDTIGHDSVYDYDPFWRRCVELGVAPGFHAVGKGWGTRTSRANYVYNHLGNFAAAQEATCRSLLMGGVFTRFPALRCCFLEGGVAWAAQLLADLVGHFEKRNKDALQRYNPAHLDLDEFEALFAEYGRGPLANGRHRGREGAFWNGSSPQEPGTTDDFEESGFTDVADIIEVFRRQLSFGCEADDPLNALAFDARVNPPGARLNAVFASDIGHWDVPDVRGVLPEAWELVEDGLIDADQFREFACDNLVRMATGVNPAFFRGTVVEDRVPEAVPGRSEGS